MASFVPSFRDFIEPNILGATPETLLSAINAGSDDRNIPVVYGLQRIIPPRIFIRISDLDPNTLVCVYALSEGECLGVYRLFVNDTYVQTNQPMALDESDIPAGSTNRTIVTPETTSSYSGIAEFEFLAGNERYLYDAYFGSVPRIDGYDSKLLEKHITNPADRPTYSDDLCLLVCAFTYLENTDSPYDGEPRIVVDLFGRRVAQSASSNTLTRAYSTNPVECLFDYLIDTNYGCALPASKLDAFSSGTTFDTSRDYADTTALTELSNTQIISNTKYTMNMVIDTAQDRGNNVQSILKSYLLMMPYVDGKFQIIAEKQQSAEVDLTEDSLIGEIRITYPDSSDRYNKIFYSYQDPQLGFYPVRRSYPTDETEYNTYLTEDNSIQNQLDISLPGVTNPYQAERIAKTYLLKSRYQAKYEFTVVKDFFKYKVGDVVRLKVTIPDLDYVSVRVVKMTLRENGLIKVEAYSHSNTFYEPFPEIVAPVDYFNPLVPTEGGVILDRPTENPIGIIPPGPGDENPGTIDDGGTGTVVPAPIVPAPSPEPTPVPDYEYNVGVSYSIDTIGGATDDYPYRFYVGGIYPEDSSVREKADATYKPIITTRNASSKGYRTLFQDYSYKLYVNFVDRTAPTNARLSMVYELPSGAYGICYKPSNSTTPIYYVWDPEFPTDYVDVLDEINGNSRITNFSEFTNEYALELEMDSKRNTSFPSLGKEGFYYFPVGTQPAFYPTGGPFGNLQNDRINGRIIRHWLNPMLEPRKNFLSDNSDFTFNIKLFHPVQKTYYGSYAIPFGPGQITSADNWTSSEEYYNATYYGYPEKPF